MYSSTKLLFGSAAIALVGAVGFAKFHGFAGDHSYMPGTSTEYHPPATADRQEALSALQQSGFQQSPDEAVKDLFVPEFQGNEAIAFDVRLSHTELEEDEATTVHAAFSLLGAAADTTVKRPPLDIAIVIDKSGSMLAENKIEFAKAASHNLVDSLQPQDRVALISYDEFAYVKHKLSHVGEHRSTLHTAIQSMSPEGGTNISDGLILARDALLDQKRGDRIARIILLSDGQATHGIETADGLGRLASETLERGISVSSMGMGLDYDEVTLHAISRASAGNYYFIESHSDTEAVFDREFADLTDTVAKDTTLTLRLAPGVSLTKVHGVDHQQRGNEVVIPLNAFTARERMDLLVELTVAPASNRLTLFETELHYLDAQTDRPFERKKSVEVAVGDAEAYVPVMRRVQQIRTMNAFLQAMRMYDSGQRHAAADLLEQQRDDNRAFLDDADLDDPAFERVDGELAELADALRKTDVRSTRGKWLKKGKFSRANSAVTNEVVF